MLGSPTGSLGAADAALGNFELGMSPSAVTVTAQPVSYPIADMNAHHGVRWIH